MFVEATAAIPSALVVVTNDRLNSSRKMTKNWCVFFFRHHGARVKKSSEKEEEPKIIACKHSEIKHDSIMIWYIDIEMNDERNKTAKNTHSQYTSK